MNSKLIYHITENSTWLRVLEEGAYRPTGFAKDGFIHCSTRAQVIPVANHLYLGKTGGLVLLVLEVEKIAAEIRWENLEGGEELFPHIYGALNLEAVKEVLPFTPRMDGKFLLTK